MKEKVMWLRDALGKANVVEHLAYYCFRNGRMEATDGNIYASVPFEGEFTGMVPGKELEIIVEEGPEGLVIERDGTIRGHNFVAQLPTGNFPWHDVSFSESTQPVDSEIFRLAKELLPFCSNNVADRIWMTGVISVQGRLVAVTANRLVVTKEPVTQGFAECVLPRWIVDFAARRSEGLIGMHLTSDALFLEWQGGRWARSRLLEYAGIPVARIQDLFSVCLEDGDWRPVTPSLQVAMRHAVRLSDAKITIHPDRFLVESKLARVSVNDTTGVTKPRSLSAAVFEPVVSFAEEVSFEHANNVFRFRNKDFVGLMTYMMADKT